MSLRMQITGFSHSQMVSCLGSKDSGLKKYFAAEFQHQYLNGGESLENENTLKRAVNVIELAIDQGIASDNLEVEDDVCCYVMNLLAHYNQTHVLTDSSDWKMQVLWDFQEQYSSQLSPAMNTILHHLIDGRPVLGKRMQTSWSYYAYLLNGEVRELTGEVSNIQRRFCHDPSYSKYSEFINEFEGWLLTILEEQNDLWFWAE